jgi:glycolate oxidase FAD binding subunit
MTEIHPTTLDELSAALRDAHAAGQAVIPRGSGTKQGLGNPPTHSDVVLSLAGLNRVVEHDVPNLTVTAQAGMRLADLQVKLAEANQFLPLDPPQAGATLGGVIAAGDSGPLRFHYGTARDLVLGLSVVLADGTPLRLGGKVMKNVAGYDLVKLHIGALGTLGVIADATFRLYARPETEVTLLAVFEDLAMAMQVVGWLLTSSAEPRAVELLDRRAAATAIGMDAGNFSLLVRQAGPVEAVERQVRNLDDKCRANGAQDVVRLDGTAGSAVWAGLRDLPDRLWTQAGDFAAARASVRIAQTGPMLAEVQSIARSHDLPVATAAHAGNGVVRIYLSADHPTQVATALGEIRERATRLGGHLVVWDAPSEVKTRIPVWGPDRPDWQLVRALKAQFDPVGILNPGRFVGGV